MSRWLAPGLILGGLLAAWQAAAASGALADALGLEEFLVPSPSEIAAALWEERDLLADNAWVTLREVLLGLLCAIAAGLALAPLLHLSQSLRRAIYPLIALSQAIPFLAIAPIFAVLFGFGIGPKVLLIALICFFPVAVNTADGLRAVDPAAIKMMRTLDASRAQILRRLEAPAALPQFFGGVRIAAVVAPIAAVFAEWAGSEAGLGHMIVQDSAQLQTARMFAAVAVLAAIAILLLALVAVAERRVVTLR